MKRISSICFLFLSSIMCIPSAFAMEGPVLVPVLENCLSNNVDELCHRCNNAWNVCPNDHGYCESCEERCSQCEECVICLDVFTGNNEINLSCNHKFHNQCLKGWTDSGSNRSSCPLCRKDIVYKGTCELCKKRIASTDRTAFYTCKWRDDWVSFNHSQHHTFHETCLERYIAHKAVKRRGRPVFFCPAKHSHGTELEDFRYISLIPDTRYTYVGSRYTIPQHVEYTCFICKNRIDIEKDAKELTMLHCEGVPSAKWITSDPLDENHWYHASCLLRYVNANTQVYHEWVSLKSAWWIPKFIQRAKFPCPFHRGTPKDHFHVLPRGHWVVEPVESDHQ